MLEIICGYVFFQVQEFLDTYKNKLNKIDEYEEGKDLVLKITDQNTENKELDANVN